MVSRSSSIRYRVHSKGFNKLGREKRSVGWLNFLTKLTPPISIVLLIPACQDIPQPSYARASLRAGWEVPPVLTVEKR